jgi:hypothetical protein
MTPILFNEWYNWGKIVEEEMSNLENMRGEIRAMGDKVGPDWMKYEFNSYEEFYKHYCELLGLGE